jgi:Glucodextranase, domain B/PASTA domain
VRRLALLATLALAGCGTQARPATTPRVELKLASPGDGRMLRADTVDISGTVAPAGAAVTVAGRAATVDGPRFTATVPLQPGGNVIDVTASSPGHRPAADALRVIRDMRVQLPALTGYDESDAFDRLKGLGLRPVEKRDDSWIDRLIPGSVGVCATQPKGGTLVSPHSAVTVVVAKDC